MDTIKVITVAGTILIIMIIVTSIIYEDLQLNPVSSAGILRLDTARLAKPRQFSNLLADDASCAQPTWLLLRDLC